MYIITSQDRDGNPQHRHRYEKEKQSRQGEDRTGTERIRKGNRKKAPRDVEDVSWDIGTFIYISLFYITNKVLCMNASYHGPPAANADNYWPPRPPKSRREGKKRAQETSSS
jgi:hypothetical protein